MKEAMKHKLWKELKDKFMKTGTENKLYMRTKLYRFQYLPGVVVKDANQIEEADPSQETK